MLDELRIAGLGVIDEAVLPLGPGLTVLTGETGAGKTMLVSALLLLFGGRADATRVRTGASQASVDGRVLLDAGSPALTRVEDAGGAVDEDGSVLLRRVVSSAGRSRAFVGGAPAPVSVLAELADRLVAVHGQSDQLRLTRPSQHRTALDRYAGIDLGPYFAAFSEWRDAAQRLADRTARARELRLEAEMLTRGLVEIAAVAPQPAEDIRLAAEASRLAHADSLRVAAQLAHNAVLGDPDDPASDAVDVMTLVGAARRALAQTAGVDQELATIESRLDEFAALAADIGSDLAAYRDDLDADPQRLEQVETRRAALGGLLRRYGEDVDAVLKWADAARLRLDELDVSDDALARLADERDALAARAQKFALAVSADRVDAAGRLAKAVTDELAALAMPSARVLVEVRRRPATTGRGVLTIDGQPVGVGASGIDEVEITLQPHSDSPAVSLGRGASGGELSRVMLAIEVCLADTDPVPTMVFDEIDAGVGGRAATEVGHRLARLARARQVIVVTHLAQVAAFADRQIVVDKPDPANEGVSRSDVRIVDGDRRIEELARMLSGSDSETARQHARELLESAEIVRQEDARSPGLSSPRRRSART